MINFCLRYIADLDIPIKRGNFIELRNGILNVSPIGRNCSSEERKEFNELNLKNKIIHKFREEFLKKFKDIDVNVAMGGQISMDIFPIGWDKSYALMHLKDFSEIHFFGDKTDLGGNDYEMFISDHTIGHKIENPDHLKLILDKEFFN